jgi:hypothetical protein
MKADQRAVIVYRPASIPTPEWLPAFGERVQVALASAYHCPRIVLCAWDISGLATRIAASVNMRNRKWDVNLEILLILGVILY